uniref:Phosphatidylethanolamine-binding protein n=1 Tax=Panagrolaimus sp. ES5 TaxID=591445 RepID=A0AC34FVV2_9BILA
MSSSSSQVSEAFAYHGIIPDVIQKAPENKLNVSFGNGLKVELGNVLTPSQVKKQPHNIEWNADKNALYTLVKTDLDAPSRDDPKFREWLHWLVVNIPGTNVGDGKILSEYIGPGPLDNSEI